MVERDVCHESRRPLPWRNGVCGIGLEVDVKIAVAGKDACHAGDELAASVDEGVDTVTSPAEKTQTWSVELLSSCTRLRRWAAASR